MEQAVTHQPRLSFSKRLPSDVQYQQMAEFIPGSEQESWRPEVIPTVSDPVLTQPGLGVTTTTITTISQTGGDWSTELFDVCSDRTIGILGAFVPCCLDLSLAHQFGESFCLPLLPGSTLALRVGIRESVCDDWTTVCCCYPLALCQMKREMTKRMKTKTYHVITALDSS
ncbi:cornifelin homolog B isoform X2 [Boleophthalmus pectinirostris]|uniref:cornifelin homolog B isoform X2 n=1 Tax=Boleophthalmus pectinirostris TaxID=150288 RepID=UPI00242B4404|nr:cornifelin homolog B isoform X2 [Boleophthalmus pectinirostris]